MTALATLLTVALLLAPAGLDEPGQTPLVPVEQVGLCRGSGIGGAFLRDAGAQALPVPDCNLAVSIGDASLSFFRAGERTPHFLFSGRRGTRAGFDVERIGIGADPVRETSSGRCLRLGTFAIMCHAVFEEAGVRKGVALTFDLPRGTETSRRRNAPAN